MAATEPDWKDWKNFSVFTGEALLDHTVFGSTNPDGSKTTLSQDITLFRDKIEKLKSNVNAAPQGSACCGIPARFVPPVRDLLAKFFPSNDNVDISCTEGDNPNLKAPVPVHVPWGPQNRGLTIPIIDGPAALGYIFTAAEPPSGATFGNYVVPLHAIFSRCLYLYYIRFIMSGDPPQAIASISDVPFMTCSMYFEFATAGGGKQIHFLLGSTYNIRYSALGQKDAENLAKNRLMTKWRREEILDAALQRSYDPQVPILPTPPILVDDLIRAVWSMLLNLSLKQGGVPFDKNPPLVHPGQNPNPWNMDGADAWVTVPKADVDTQFAIAVGVLEGLWLAEYAPNPPPALVVPWDRKTLLNRPYPRPKIQLLRDALRKVIQVRWSSVPPYDRNGDAIKQALQDVFAIMYFPHMYQALPPKPVITEPAITGPAITEPAITEPAITEPAITEPTITEPAITEPAITEPAITKPPTLQPDVNNEMKFKKTKAAATQAIKTACDALVAALWTEHHGAVLDMLDRVHFWAENADNGLEFGGLMSIRYGRCAETYPVAGLTNGFLPDRVLPNNTAIPPVAGTPVRGVSMAVRVFTNDPAMAPTLAGSFSMETLDAMHKAVGGGVYRALCANCQSLLPCFDVPVGKENYDADIDGWGIKWKN